ncbi:hypothetical protein ACFVW2_25090 [Streptomyces sp. NPDC058171]
MTENPLLSSASSGTLCRVTGEGDASKHDEAWAMEMLHRIKRGAQEAHERRDALAAAVDEMADGFAQLGLKQSWAVGRKSPAREDMKAPHVLLGDRAEPVATILRYESAVNILSAADQLRGFAVLLRAEASLMGAVSVARGIFEACLWATAVIDPTITTDERLKRALTRRLARLSAGIRLKKMLGDGVTDRVIDNDGHADDQHGTHRDPAKDIADIEIYAESRGWPVTKGSRTPWITRLSIDWLSENLERRIGIEGYAWTSGSSMAHGEHAADTASWVELSQDIGTAPAWLIRSWSTGAWAGPRLFRATLAGYTGRESLGREYQRFEELFREEGKG